MSSLPSSSSSSSSAIGKKKIMIKDDDNDNDDNDILVDWDDIAFDPHQDSFDAGRKEGQAAGELAGFQDGQRLGHTKGIEFGIELGFIQGFVNSLMLMEEKERANNNNTKKEEAGKQQQDEEQQTSKSQRIQRSLLGLQKALDDFPSPESLFENNCNNNNTTTTIPQQPDAEDNENDSETVVTKLDIVAKMQRVRARFKLLTVQLGMGSNISLKQVLSQQGTTPSSGEKTRETREELTTQEW